MKLLIELDEEYVKVIDKIKFLVGGRTDRKLQLEIIKAIKNGKALEQEPCEDCVSREQALLVLTGENLSSKSAYELIVLFNKRIKDLPSVTPQELNNLGVEKIEVRKPCINYEDGCEEWAGCPCVHFKCRK